jgi:hypothetical protein
MKHDLKINDIGVGVNLLDEADAPADGFRLDFTHRDRGNTDVNVGEGEANGFLLAASASGAGEDRLLSVPFKNAETETKNGHRGTTTSDVGEGEDRLLSVSVPVKNAETETSNLGHRRRTTTSDVGEGEDRLLSVSVPVKNAETETSNLGHRRRTTTSDVGEGEDRLLSVSVPVKNAETETSNLGHRRTTTVGEADKAGKASPPNFDEGAGPKRHRERQHQCDSMYPFEGSYVYQGGCGGNSFEVLITCENKGRKEESRNGVICNYYEETLVSVCVCV